MIAIKRYVKLSQDEWDHFVGKSKNGCFLFIRDYMEYHSNRYQDNSLMVYRNDTLCAVIPCNITGKQLVSHGGLTFGGIISDKKMKTQVMLDIFKELLLYMKENSIESFLYKVPPRFLHQIPAEEDLYALFRVGAHLVRRDVSTVVDMSNLIQINKGRKWLINKAKKGGITVAYSDEYEVFMEILSNALARHDAVATHTVDEIIYLKNKFPENIALCVASLNGKVLAGAVTYDYGQTIHTQYLATSEEGKKNGALDYLIHEMVSNIYKGKRYFSFGVSTLNNGFYLNEGLIYQKEGFGGRAVVHDFYEVRV